VLSPDDPKLWYRDLQEQKEALEEKLSEALTLSEEQRQSLLARGELSADEAKIWISEEVQKLQAQLDIVIEEIEELEHRQKVEADKKKKAEEEHEKAKVDRKYQKGYGSVRSPLERGAEGHMIMNGDRVVSIDGQKISYNKRGEPFIDDSNSPYDGLLLYRYRREVVTPYQKAKQEAVMKAKEEKLAQAKKLRAEAVNPKVDVELPLIVAGPHNKRRKNEEE
jgi:TolA-binding protein